MFGRTTRLFLLLLATQLSSGCFCCCEHPLFWRFKGGCCEPCQTCCSAPTPCCGPAPTCCGGGPGMPMGAMPMTAAMPVYHNQPMMVPTVPVSPANNPTSDRIAPISSTAMSNVR